VRVFLLLLSRHPLGRRKKTLTAATRLASLTKSRSSPASGRGKWEKEAWREAPVGEAAVARAALRTGGRLGRCASRTGSQLRCSPSPQMTNARAVSDPGACVTIARQPPCNFRPHASFKAELEAIPEPRPLTCVSRSKLLSGDWCLVIAKQRVAARLRRACVESATAPPWLPVIAIRLRVCTQ